MTRRLTALALVGAALLSLGAAPAPSSPVTSTLTGPTADPVTPFPLGACVYVRPYDPDSKYCVIVRDPR